MVYSPLLILHFHTPYSMLCTLICKVHAPLIIMSSLLSSFSSLPHTSLHSLFSTPPILLTEFFMEFCVLHSACHSTYAVTLCCVHLAVLYMPSLFSPCSSSYVMLHFTSSSPMPTLHLLLSIPFPFSLP